MAGGTYLRISKARELHNKLCERRGERGSANFTASNVRMWRLSKRHGIRQLLLHVRNCQQTGQQHDKFISRFQEFIEENHYTLHQV